MIFLIISDICDSLCKEGEGGSLCTCDTQPPAYNQQPRDICQDLCKSGEAGSLCTCDTQPPARKQDSEQRDDRKKRTIVNRCECCERWSDRHFLFRYDSAWAGCYWWDADRQSFTQTNSQKTLHHCTLLTSKLSFTTLRLLFFAASGLCVDLCRTGEAGTLCTCDTQPPAHHK